MNLSNKHKSLLITLLVSGTIVLSLFSFHIKKQNELMAESYYLLEPEETKTLEELEAEKLAEAEEQQVSETNKAYNETQEYKKFAEAYQPIAPPKDYVPKPSENMSEHEASETGSTPTTSEIDDDVLSSYSSVNDVLNKRSPSSISDQSVNKKSSMHYSLVNRTHEFLPTPIYLCEEGGKIIVNITVNASGLVTDAYVNAASTSNNDCLKEHALDYANEARFNSDASKPSQIGSITFYFEGKK